MSIIPIAFLTTLAYADSTGSNNIVIEPTTNDAVNISQMAKDLDQSANLDSNAYISIPLQSIEDPTTGIKIDDTYLIEVPEKLSLKQAQNVLSQVSPKLSSNNAAIAANELQSEATKGLNRPTVFLRAQATHYELNADIDLTNVKSGINNGGNQIISNELPNPPVDPNLLLSIPPIISSQIPDNYNYKRKDDTSGAGVAVLWPIYTAGRTDAITNLADARTDESQADALLDNDSLQTTLIERYFSAQLAMIASYLRDDALNTIRKTDHMAQRMLEEGFISRVERLEAQAALADAESEAIKARNDADLAMTALQRLLRTPTPVKPTSPLFVSSNPLPPLEYFQNMALQNHPGLKKVDAKYAQAESLNQLSNANNKPTISVFGYHEIDKHPSWMAGISASWKLWGGLDNTAQHASGQAKMRQALLAKIDASDNILLLVEKNWKSVENARVRYHALSSNVKLAAELQRLKQLGLQEGVNTALEATTAQTQYLKARTEQAAAANDYVLALAALMESIGTPHAFNDYMAAADIKLPTLY